MPHRLSDCFVLDDSPPTTGKIFVDIGGVAARKRVESGETDGSLTEIISGVSPGDQVVTEGGAILSDGMKLSTGSSTPTSESAQ